MKKFELHCHSSGPSVCADVTDEQLIEKYANAGYNGIVVTNHINGSYNNYPGETHKEKIDYYFHEVAVPPMPELMSSLRQRRNSHFHFVFDEIC